MLPGVWNKQQEPELQEHGETAHFEEPARAHGGLEGHEGEPAPDRQPEDWEEAISVNSPDVTAQQEPEGTKMDRAAPDVQQARMGYCPRRVRKEGRPQMDHQRLETAKCLPDASLMILLTYDGTVKTTEAIGPHAWVTPATGGASLLFLRADALNLKLLKGIGAELVCHALLDAVALDHVTGLNIVGQENYFSAHRAARALHLGHAPNPVFLARPERETGSVRAIEDLTLVDPGRDLNFLPSPFAPDLRHHVTRQRSL